MKEAAIDALIEQGGAIHADGSTVLLTAKAAGDIASTVINHTGITEARTLATGEQGEIVLLGDFENDRIEVAGTLDAGAPNGGDGGFIETSAAKVKIADDLNVTTRAVEGATGEWLIDPVDFTIAASGGDIAGAALAMILGTSDVTIHTDTGTDSFTDQYGASGTAGDIHVNDTVTWSANTLTLNAYNNIEVNANLDATGVDGTGTGSLALEYGQGAEAEGNTSTYTVTGDAKILIPTPTAFTWKKGSDSDTNKLVLGNDLFRLGDGTVASIDATTMQAMEPFYYDEKGGDAGTGAWYGTTNGNSLDLEIGVGYDDGSSSPEGWNREGVLIGTSSNTGGGNVAAVIDLSDRIVAQSLDISGYQEGTGTIVSTIAVDTDASVDGTADISIDNAYTLEADASSLKTETTVSNETDGALSNVRLWVGARDDSIAGSDTPSKSKGNVTDGSFAEIDDPTTQAKAIQVTVATSGGEGGTDGGSDGGSDGEDDVPVLFYTDDDAYAVMADSGDFTNVTNTDPLASDGETTTDQTNNSYALFMQLPNLEASGNEGNSSTLTWHMEPSVGGSDGDGGHGRGNKFGHLPKEERGRALAALAIAQGGLGVGRKTKDTADNGIDTTVTDTTVTDTTGIDTAAVETGDGSVATDGAPTTIGGMEVENVSSGDGADAMDADGDSGADAVDLILAQADSNPTGDTVYTVDGGISDGAPETTQADTGVSEDGNQSVEGAETTEGTTSAEGTESGEGAEAGEESGAEEGMETESETEAGDSEGKKGKAKGKTKDKARGKAKGHDKA